MADQDDHPEAANIWAKRTFWATAVIAILYVGSVFAFILYR